MAKKGCQRITRKSCNLTVETGNHTELYYARVTAVSAGGRSATKMTDRFNSLQHSELEPLWVSGEGRGKRRCLRGGMASSPLEWVEGPEGASARGGGQLGMWLLGKAPTPPIAVCP